MTTTVIVRADSHFVELVEIARNEDGSEGEAVVVDTLTPGQSRTLYADEARNMLIREIEAPESPE